MHVLEFIYCRRLDVEQGFGITHVQIELFSVDLSEKAFVNKMVLSTTRGLGGAIFLLRKVILLKIL